MVIDQKFIGKKYPIVTYEIGKEKVKEFTKAVKADPEKYTEYIPLTFPVVYSTELLANVLFDAEIKPDLRKLVHGEQEFIYFKPVKIGETITSEGSIENIFQKGPHDFIVFKIESKNKTGELVCKSLWTLIIRGGNDKDFTMQEKLMMWLAGMAPDMSSTKAPERQGMVNFNMSGREKEMTVHIDKYMPQIYAGASGDFNAIHLDEKLGKASGLGGNILHGMATMALGANLALQNHKPEEAKRYKARFSSTVKPLDTLTYKGTWSDDGKSFSFNATNQDGQEVISSCLVEFN